MKGSDKSMPQKFPEYTVFKDGSLRKIPKLHNNVPEKKNSRLQEKTLHELDVNKSEDIKNIYKKMECLIDNVEQMRIQINELKLENTIQKQNNLNNKESDEKKSSANSEDNVTKYTNVAKIVANVIEILADGIISIIDSINDSSRKESTSTDESSDQNLSKKKLDISGILKSTESLISSLTNSFKE